MDLTIIARPTPPTWEWAGRGRCSFGQFPIYDWGRRLVYFVLSHIINVSGKFTTLAVCLASHTLHRERKGVACETTWLSDGTQIRWQSPNYSPILTSGG